MANKALDQQVLSLDRDSLTQPASRTQQVPNENKSFSGEAAAAGGHTLETAESQPKSLLSL